MEKTLTQSDFRRLAQSAKILITIRKELEWLKRNGVHFIEPSHKTFDECVKEAEKRYGEDECSDERSIFLAGTMWASGNE